MTSTLSYAREGERLHLNGDTEASLRLLAEGARRFPSDVTGRLVLARVCRESGRAREARDWLESVLRTDAECPSARLQLAGMLGGVEAEEHLAYLRAQEPWDEAFESDLAAEAARGSFLGEAPISQKAPDSVSSVSFPSSVSDFEMEDEELEPEIDLDDLPHVATVTLAEIYLQQGLVEQAAQIYRQLLEREPGDASVQKRLEEIESSTSEAPRENGGTTGGNG